MRIVAGVVALTLLLSACGPGDADQPTRRLPVESPSAKVESPTTKESKLKLRLIIGDQHFQAAHTPSAAARDLIAQLPLTIAMTDHGGVEKTGPLPSPLSLDDQPPGADPAVGDLGYYAPGNDLVLYYGAQSYHDGIVILGRLQSDAAERIAALDGSIEVRVVSFSGSGGSRSLRR